MSKANDITPAKGRSPRGRRSPHFRRLRETSQDTTVDLRVGGGAIPRRLHLPTTAGRSPRGRRSLSSPRLDSGTGSISAWAEEPTERAAPKSKGVDLRVGGGAAYQGASFDPRDGSISAWAEEPALAVYPASGSRVDLRVGGGAAVRFNTRPVNWGRSPRGRRSPDLARVVRSESGSISAWAEEPLMSPRLFLATQGRSPRGRRSPAIGRGRFVDGGSISAWAEEPCPDGWDKAHQGVDLRVGGGACMLFSL